MADVYGVTAADVAAELPGLFPRGFSASTQPTSAQVASWIATADAIVSMKIQDVTGQAPATTDKAAALARQYVIEWVKGKVVGAVYAGNDPVQVANATKPHFDNAKTILTALSELGAQATGTGEAASRVVVPYTEPQRDLLITDEQLDNDEGERERRY